MLKDIFAPVVAQTTEKGQGYLEWSGNGQRLEVIKNLVDGNLEDWENLYEAFDELHDSIQKVDSPSAQQEFLMDNPNKPVVWLPDLVCNTASSEEDLDMKLAGIDINKLWIDYVKEWTIRNGHNEISDDNKGDELLNQSEPKELRKALTTDDNSLEVWGWVNLAYAEGWVTRGPEPNPVGGQD
jgi:hypothetical protein